MNKEEFLNKLRKRLDVLEDKYTFPIIKSNNFGHTEKKTVIPVGGRARIDTSKKVKIEITENFME